MEVVPDDRSSNVISFTPVDSDPVEGLSNELYDIILRYDERLSVCEILGILKLLSDEISDEARND